PGKGSPVVAGERLRVHLGDRAAAQLELDYHRWKALLKLAGVRDGRLHDARHTAATVLLVLGVPERTVMGIMGWSSTSMAARYQHVTGAIREVVAAQVGGLLWAEEAAADDAN
ncbi:MAG TPA: tyrosine-type recombinase/integrase, partial [Propionibacteriaceae bacterium]|nr:tyrosine-type recombinase/integrase [Propionibacteriaceae bacterium]